MLWLYWPRSDRVSLAETCSRHLKGVALGWRCFRLFTTQQKFLQPPGEICVSERLCIVFVSLLHMGLNYCWELTKKEDEKSVYSSGNSPLETQREIIHCVFGCLCVVWMLKFLIVSEVFQHWTRLYRLCHRQTHCTLSPTDRWWCVRGRQTNHPQTRSSIINSNRMLVLNDAATPLHDEQRQLLRDMSAVFSIRSKLWVVTLGNRQGYCIWSLPSLIIYAFEYIHSSTDVMKAHAVYVPHTYQCKGDHYGNSQIEVNFNNCSK